jgi:hypothetical protein
VRQFTALVALVAIAAPLASRAAEPALAIEGDGLRPGTARPAERPPVPGADGVRLRSPRMAASLRRAVRGAARHLAEPACAALLGDFEDASGRPLRERLDTLGIDPSDWTRRVLFYDGTDERRCRRDSRLLAFTAPGSHVVRVCRGLVDLARVDPDRAEVVVIHEVLHTLGLGEDPPSSLEITARVRSRCAR